MLLCPAVVQSQCSTTITTFPYIEDFETSAGNWTTGGSWDDWAWGSPAKPVINLAASGSNCWIVGGLTTSFYNYDERSYCVSPCFDFTSVAIPYIEVSIFWETEKKYDGANLQYSLNQGSTWFNVGSANDPIDCFNEHWFNQSALTNITLLASILQGWSGNIQPTAGSCQGGSGSNGWVRAKHTMPYLAGKASVMFRFIFGAGSACNDYDGFAFDNIWIGERPDIFTVIPAIVIDTCSRGVGAISLAVSGGNPPYNYQWSGGVAAGNIATGLAAGAYTVTITDLNNCTVSKTMVVDNSDPVSFSMSIVDDTCMGGKGMAQVTVSSGSSPYSYHWAGFSNVTNTLSGLIPGSYTVIVTDSLGCMDSALFNIANVNTLHFDIDSVTTFCQGESALLDMGNYTSYLWSDGSTNAQLAIPAEGTYTVTVTNSDGCTAEDSISFILDCNTSIFIPNTFSPNDDNTNELFMPRTIYVEWYEMRIFNREGTQIFNTTNIEEGWNGTFENKPCPEGIYVYTIRYKKPKTDKVTLHGVVHLIR